MEKKKRIITNKIETDDRTDNRKYGTSSESNSADENRMNRLNRINISIIILLLLAFLNVILLYQLINVQNEINKIVDNNQCFKKINESEDKFIICNLNYYRGENVWRQ